MHSLSKKTEDTNCCNKIPVTRAMKTEQRQGTKEKSELDFSDIPCPPLLMVSQNEYVTFRKPSGKAEWYDGHNVIHKHYHHKLYHEIPQNNMSWVFLGFFFFKKAWMLTQVKVPKRTTEPSVHFSWLSRNVKCPTMAHRQWSNFLYGCVLKCQREKELHATMLRSKSFLRLWKEMEQNHTSLDS